MSLAVEKVSLDSNEGNNITVSVVSRGLAYSSHQKFALVITGNVSVSSGACNVTTWPTPQPTPAPTAQPTTTHLPTVLPTTVMPTSTPLPTRDECTSDGTIKSAQKISSLYGNLPYTLPSKEDYFGISVSALADLDGDGVVDLTIGAHKDDDGGSDRARKFHHLSESD